MIKPLKKKTYEIPDCWTQEPFHHKKKQIEKDDWQDTDFSSYKNTSWKRKTTVIPRQW